MFHRQGMKSGRAILRHPRQLPQWGSAGSALHLRGHAGDDLFFALAPENA